MAKREHNKLLRSEYAKQESKLARNKLTAIRAILFFFNVLLALLITSSSYFLINSDIGKLALLLGISMLALNVFLRLVKKW